jgi:hypothetical protein
MAATKAAADGVVALSERAEQRQTNHAGLNGGINAMRETTDCPCPPGAAIMQTSPREEPPMADTPPQQI